MKTINSLVLLLLFTCSTQLWAQERNLDVPYVPTPQTVVDAMLNVAKVNSNDVVYDLGCGDGRIVVTAAKKYGATGVGIDLDAQRVKEANENAKKAGVQQKVQFHQGDLFEFDFSKASVLTLYLLPDVNLKLKPKILPEMKPGSRVVSHSFNMGDRKPEQEIVVDGRTVYLWIVPQK